MGACAWATAVCLKAFAPSRAGTGSCTERDGLAVFADGAEPPEFPATHSCPGPQAGPWGSLGIQRCSPPPPSPRQHRSTCIALPFAQLPIPHRAHPAACLLHHTYKTSQGQCPTDWAGKTVSCCHIQLVTDIGGQGCQLPGPSPHARNGGTRAGADGSTAAVGTLLLLSRFIFCRPTLRRPGHKAPPVLSDPREQRRNCLLTASQKFLLCSWGIRESGRWPHSPFLEASHPLVSQGHLKVFCRDPD